MTGSGVAGSGVHGRVGAVGARLEALLHQTGDVGAVDRLVLEQGLGDGIERTAMLQQHLVGPAFLLVQDP